MISLKSGEILALVGVVLLLANTMLRRQFQKAGPARGLTRFWLGWGDVVVFLILLAGLTLMWSQK